MAMFDPLTGLYNRRFAEPRVEAEVKRCQRKGTALTLLLLDLDGFKQINDSHGHPVGDTVLRAFAEHITRAIRGSDLAARLGGDEFMLLLPECDSEPAPARAPAPGSSSTSKLARRKCRSNFQLAGKNTSSAKPPRN